MSTLEFLKILNNFLNLGLTSVTSWADPFLFHSQSSSVMLILNLLLTLSLMYIIPGTNFERKDTEKITKTKRTGSDTLNMFKSYIK